VNKFLTPYRYVRRFGELQDKFSNKNYDAIQHSDQILKEFQRVCAPERNLDEVAEIFKEAKIEYFDLIQQKAMEFPQIWNGGEVLAGVLYTLVSINNPKVVLETGVANGISTEMILKKLSKSSTLHSFDVKPESINSVKGGTNWVFHLLNGNNPKKSFKLELSRLQKEVDIWVHDSDHSRYWQTFEYKQALNSLKYGGFLISDDINTSSAWGKLFNKKDSLVISDGHKKVGIYRKN
jgi:predicted O-methyltransferase YrrM